mmetsp:Transcript_12162/g.30780  ORF Transcript_12162/g.30780 Transcript_12162/m.30780 type:complete len:221 (+) Transcript_12162:953-1615(+)
MNEFLIFEVLHCGQNKFPGELSRLEQGGLKLHVVRGTRDDWIGPIVAVVDDNRVWIITVRQRCRHFAFDRLSKSCLSNGFFASLELGPGVLRFGIEHADGPKVFFGVLQMPQSKLRRPSSIIGLGILGIRLECSTGIGHGQSIIFHLDVGLRPIRQYDSVGWTEFQSLGIKANGLKKMPNLQLIISLIFEVQRLGFVIILVGLRRHYRFYDYRKLLRSAD